METSADTSLKLAKARVIIASMELAMWCQTVRHIKFAIRDTGSCYSVAHTRV